MCTDFCPDKEAEKWEGYTDEFLRAINRAQSSESAFTLNLPCQIHISSVSLATAFTVSVREWNIGLVWVNKVWFDFSMSFSMNVISFYFQFLLVFFKNVINNIHN